jgi:hypothetical protein
LTKLNVQFINRQGRSIELEGGEVKRGEKGVFDGFWATPMKWDGPLA